MQYALDTNGSWANAKLTEYKKHNRFFCGCVDRHSVKLVKPSGAEGKRPFSDYFAHITRTSGGSGQHDTGFPGCTESFEHFNAKHRLREMVGLYSFTTFRCIKCDETLGIDTGGCEVTVEVPSKDRKWRYDGVLSRDGSDIAALEVLHSHKVSDAKASSVRGSGLEIAEFRAEDVLELLGDRPTDTVHLENLLVQLGICQECLVRGGLMWRRDCFVDELRELMQQEADMGVYYRKMGVRRRNLERRNRRFRAQFAC